MFDAVVCFFRSLLAGPQQDELLIRIPVEEKRDTLRGRR